MKKPIVSLLDGTYSNFNTIDHERKIYQEMFSRNYVDCTLVGIDSSTIIFQATCGWDLFYN